MGYIGPFLKGLATAYLNIFDQIIKRVVFVRILKKKKRKLVILGRDSIFRLKNAPLACVAAANLHIGPSAQDSVQKFNLSCRKQLPTLPHKTENLLLAVFVTDIGQVL